MSYKKEFGFKLEKVLGIIKDSDKHSWGKSVMKISWNGNPTTIDIRNYNFAKDVPGKGISLTDEDAEKLVHILLENGYGDIKILKDIVDKNQSRFYSEEELNASFKKEEDS